MTDTEQTPAPAAAPPRPFLAGTFALYRTPKGEVVVSVFTEMTGDRQMKVPRLMVRKAIAQNPLLAQLMEQGDDHQEETTDAVG